MKKTFAIALTSLIAVGTFASSVSAAEWYDRYDRNHDQHWDYNEFRNAHRAWERRHHEQRRLSDAELHAQFDKWDTEHHGWVSPEAVRGWHQW